MMSFASPRTPAPFPQMYTITCLHGVVRLSMGGGNWTVEVLSEDEKVKTYAGEAGQQGGQVFPSCGVKEELRQFAQAILGTGQEPNRGQPRDALWDVAFIQAALTSNGKTVELNSL